MRRATRNPFFWLLLVALALVFIAPIVYMILTAFKTNVDAQTAPPSLLPREWTTQAFTTLFNDPGAPVLSWLLNSVLIASIFAVVSVLVCAMAGYAVARMQFPGRNAVFVAIISTMFIPGFVFLMPNFELLSKLGWLDSYQALILPGAASAFGLFFMRQFFLSLPQELEESARLDGANPLRIFFSIMLPNARPAVSPCWCCSSWPTGTTSCGRCTCCSARTCSPCRSACRACRAPTPSTTPWSWPAPPWLRCRC
ncbi:carbohydrate ABC transporter permease [Propionibacteriaceae bacterium Y1923]